MLKRLLGTLGFIKPQKLDFLSKVELMHDFMVSNILTEKRLAQDLYNKAACEVNVFLFCVGLPIVKQNAPEALFNSYMLHIRNNVIFKNIDKNEFTPSYLESFIQSRIKFHQEGISSIDNTYKYESYLLALDCLWSYEALSEESDMEHLATIASLRKGGFRSMITPIEMRLFFIQVLPVFSDNLLKCLLEEKLENNLY